MQNQENKKQEEPSIDDRLAQFIEKKEAEQKALKKMIEQLEEDSARKLNQTSIIYCILNRFQTKEEHKDSKCNLI